MNILITGAAGFIGKNLIHWLKQSYPDANLLCCDIDNSNELPQYARQADFVYHLAGVNRPQNPSQFTTGNISLTEELLQYCKEGKRPPILFTSTAQATLDNAYGISKKAAEDAVRAYGNDTKQRVYGNDIKQQVYIYRLPGVFGKWCRPNYNSVVATFCHNIANDLPIEVRDPAFELSLVYIDDVCRCFIGVLKGHRNKTYVADRADKADKTGTSDEFCYVEPIHTITLGQLADTLTKFQQGRDDLHVPVTSNVLKRKLHSTYLSYLTDFSYSIRTHADERGSFSELIKTPHSGQVSVNITKPGFTKGNHWHHTKAEKFITVSGKGIIRFRKIGDNTVTEYPVSGGNITVVDIPPGYTHSLTNIGTDDLITIMWANEIYDPTNPDTFFEPVLLKEVNN